MIIDVFQFNRVALYKAVENPNSLFTVKRVHIKNPKIPTGLPTDSPGK